MGIVKVDEEFTVFVVAALCFVILQCALYGWMLHVLDCFITISILLSIC